MNPGAVGKAQHLGAVQRDVGGEDDAPPQGVLNVVVDVGDVVGQPDHLALQGGGVLALGVAENAVADLPGQIQALSVFLQPVHHPQGLLVVPKATLHHSGQRPLPGVAEGGVPQVVGQRRRLGEILVQPQPPGHGTGDAGHLQGVGHTGAVMVPLGLQKHLGLVLQPPEGFAVYHPVHVPLKAGTHGTGRDFRRPALGIDGQAGPGRQGLAFQRLGAFPNGVLHTASLLLLSQRHNCCLLLIPHPSEKPFFIFKIFCIFFFFRP